MKIIFREAQTPLLTNLDDFSFSGYDVEKNPESLNRIRDILQQSDTGFATSLKNGREVQWNFGIDDGHVFVRRFKKFLPLIMRDHRTDSYLYEYQKKGVEWLRSMDACVLADDMGLGKTFQVIKACELELFHNKVQTIFVFCPISLVKNWRFELSKWLPSSNCSEFQKGALKEQILNVTFLIIPYPQMENFIKELGANYPENTISIFDEAHKLRNHSAKVSKFSRSIKSTKKWLLTGTPLERDTKDIETILTILNPGLMVAKLLSDKFLLKTRFKNLTLRRTKKDVLKDLPDVRRHVHYVELDEAQTKNYNGLVRKYRKTKGKEKIGILTELMMAATFAPNGSSTKIDKAFEICKQQIQKENKTIIFSKFNDVLETIAQKLTKSGVKNQLVYGKLLKDERNSRILKFQTEADCKVLVINLAVGSEGLTLIEANNVIFVNEAWNPSMNRQAEDRVNRLGQQKEVNVHIIRSLSTIDINLEKILKNKYQLETEYIDELINEIL